MDNAVLGQRLFYPIFYPRSLQNHFCFAKMSKEGTLLPALKYTASFLSYIKIKPNLPSVQSVTSNTSCKRELV